MFPLIQQLGMEAVRIHFPFISLRDPVMYFYSIISLFFQPSCSYLSGSDATVKLELPLIWISR